MRSKMGSDDRQPQLRPVPRMSTFDGVDPALDAKPSRCGAGKQIRPVGDAELRNREDHLRLPRQRRMKFREHTGKRRNDEHVQDRNRHADGDQHERRITRRRLQSFDRFAFEFEILRDPAERLVETTGVFTDVNHARVQVRKDVAVPLQTGCKIDTGLQIRCNPLQNLPQPRIAGGFGQSTHRTHNGYACFRERRHLMAEDDQLVDLHRGFEPRNFERGARLGFRWSNRQRNCADFAQLRRDHTRVRGFDVSRQRASVSVPCLISKTRHGGQ